MKNIPKSALLAVQVPTPPSKREQEIIAEALSDIDSLIDSLQALLHKQNAVAKGATQNLLCGRLRFPQFESVEARTSDQYGSYPVSWRPERLADLIEPDRPIRYGIVQPGAYDPKGRLMIRGQDYSFAKGWADPDEVFRVSDEIEAKYRAARVRSGDLIITIVGYCGHVEVVPEWLNGANLTQTTARISICTSKANPAFCKYMIRSDYVQRQVTAFLKGNAQPGLNCGDVENFRIPLPSPAEQQCIAEFLKDVESYLEEIRLRLEKAREIKRGMMQDLLTGKVRLI